jgi:2-polyprenyl-3-methyl-5-hydroxy-6-metoxy-1,4-benzoquinol methylase
VCSDDAPACVQQIRLGVATAITVRAPGKLMLARDRYFDFLAEARTEEDLVARRHRFERWAQWYERRLRKHLPMDRTVSCLDVPCGSGNFLYFLRRQAYVDIVGCDISARQVALARALGLPAFKRDAMEVLSDRGRTYGLISSLDFIEHLSRDDALRFVALCHERLAPGGVLILRTPSADGPFGAHDAWNDLTHQWAMTSGVLEAILEMSGFRRVAILDERPQPYNLVNAVRVAAFLAGRAVASAAVFTLGLTPPRIWSRSMWGVGYKSG